MSDIVTRFQNARVKTGMSQSDIADKMGISLRTYQRIEANPEKLSVQDLKKYASLFVVSINTILFGDTEKSVKNNFDITEVLENHITDKELEILKAYRSLPKQRQELMYYKMKAEEIEFGNQETDLEGAKYA